MRELIKTMDNTEKPWREIQFLGKFGKKPRKIFKVEMESGEFVEVDVSSEGDVWVTYLDTEMALPFSNVGEEDQEWIMSQILDYENYEVEETRPIEDYLEILNLKKNENGKRKSNNTF